jgi:hypothetical protein
LGCNLYQGYEQKQALNALQQQEQQQAQTAQQTQQQESAAAAPLLSRGNTLISYLTTNTCRRSFGPKFSRTSLRPRLRSFRATLRGACLPIRKQNSALAQDLANVDTQATSLQANLEQTLATAGTQLTQQANALLQSGMDATQLSSQIPMLVRS